MTKATLELSVADWTQVWLNGHKIAEQDPNLSSEKGYDTLKFSSDQLCYFQQNNCLSLLITQTLQSNSVLTEAQSLGIAYVLKLSFSDKKDQIFSSNEVDGHLHFKIEDKALADPEGWKNQAYDDGSWEGARGVPPAASLTKILTNPQTHKPAEYLSAFKVSAATMVATGERDYFRRKFTMDIVPGPGCPQPRIFPTATPKPKPMPPTLTPTFTFTFTPRPTKTPIPTLTPRPTRTPTPVPVVKPKPTRTPKPIRKVTPRFSPTATPWIIPTHTPTPIRRLKAKPTAISRLTATPTFTEEPEAAESLPTTIVFVNPPVNIYVSFGDGPGRYRMEILDNQGRHLKTLFDKHVGGESEKWLEWDGTNEQGKLMPAAGYSAIFSKDGKILRKISLIWISRQN